MLKMLIIVNRHMLRDVIGVVVKMVVRNPTPPASILAWTGERDYAVDVVE
jgi:hypothetical protein